MSDQKADSAPAAGTIAITINGEARTVPSGLTIAGLIAHLGLGPAGSGRVAVECNRAIVPRAAHDATYVGAGDTLELVTFVGGGQ